MGNPQAAKSFTPTNPKTIITDALPQISGIQDNISARQLDIASGTWNNGTDDVVEVISMPVFMISQALQAMTTVKQIGEKEAKAKKIALILEILGIIFACKLPCPVLVSNSCFLLQQGHSHQSREPPENRAETSSPLVGV